MASKVDKKPAFGGYSINFSEVEDTTLGEVFGTDDMPPSEMTKLIWKFVKENELSNKPPKTPLDKLEDYWNENDFEDLEIDEFKTLLDEAGATKKTKATAVKIFKLQEKDPEEFEEQLDKFYKSFLKSQ